ncbi:hypothetical protein GLU60_01185 [Nanohaloarchaea archaeon H01]|nr:hypothetical protein [Nanohaloarchaea archaeon H01]
MEIENYLKPVLVVQLLLPIFLAFSLTQLDSDTSSYFQLYELLGALIASIITVFGLWKMKTLTDD